MRGEKRIMLVVCLIGCLFFFQNINCVNAQNAPKEPIAKLFRGGTLYCPDYRGTGDVLVVGRTIVKIAPKITLPENFLETVVVDAKDKFLVPGLIDGHIHITGAGGGLGPMSRSREIKIEDITRAGITTAVGTLGTDIYTHDLKRLLVKAQGLEDQGITTFIYNGSYSAPPINVTGSVETDLLLIDKILGTKLGLADGNSTHPSESELSRILLSVRRGAQFAGKAGVLHIHMGEAHAINYYTMMQKILKDTQIPSKHVVFTHSGSNSHCYKGSLAYAKQGGLVDFSAWATMRAAPWTSKDRGLVDAHKAIQEFLAVGVKEDQITMSSDVNAGGKKPNGEWRLSRPTELTEEFRLLARATDLTLASKMVSLNPAKRLGILSTKGTLDMGKDADLLVLDKDLQIQEVYAKGKQMVKDGKPVVIDPYTRFDKE